MVEKEYYVYMIRCLDDTLYTGITTDIERRINEHKEKGKKSAKYTYVHGVKCLEALWICENKYLAAKLEYNIKRLARESKEKIIKTADLNILSKKIDVSQYKYIKYE